MAGFYIKKEDVFHTSGMTSQKEESFSLYRSLPHIDVGGHCHITGLQCYQPKAQSQQIGKT